MGPYKKIQETRRPARSKRSDRCSTIFEAADLDAVPEVEEGEAIDELCEPAVGLRTDDRLGSDANCADTPEELEHFVDPRPATKFTWMHWGCKLDPGLK